MSNSYRQRRESAGTKIADKKSSEPKKKSVKTVKDDSDSTKFLSSKSNDQTN